MSRVFLSYRRADNPDTVKLVHERLAARLPRWQVFYDHRSLPPGEPFPDRLRQAVTAARVVLVFVGPRWLELLRERAADPVDHVREEVRLALDGDATVVPVLIGNARLPPAAELDVFSDLLPLLDRNGRQLRPEPDFDADLARLGDFLESIGPGEDVGTILAGKYKLVEEVGRGGMGVVWRADQLRPRRTVAVKMVKVGMDTREVLARFDAERQALAVMDHPGIARVLDAGTAATGRPFFVMEFVRGESITAYCDRKKLAPAGRLGLFRGVCEAVQHAHQKGIIHRDLKPSNVLVEEVDGRPGPKVIDFGLAKALGQRLTDKTLATRIGEAVGTLVYSSPEQAAGRTFAVDTRTDVYALGALLYELLAGDPPFNEAELRAVGEEAMRRAVIESDPARPSAKLSSSAALPSIAANRRLEPAKLARLVRGELDLVVMKALEKEPGRRYGTAAALGDDVGRYLAHEPVTAGRPSTAYRLRKFVRRNRAAVTAVAAVFAALVAGVAGTAWGLVEAQSQRDIAEDAATKKRQAL